MSEQVQCSLYYPSRGFQIDKVRLVGLEYAEWSSLKSAITNVNRSVPHLSQMLSSPFPFSLSRSEVLLLIAELEQFDLTDHLDGQAFDAYLTLGMFLSQVHDQREASASFEIEPGVRHQDQIVLLPGTDILADLERINHVAGK